MHYSFRPIYEANALSSYDQYHDICKEEAYPHAAFSIPPFRQESYLLSLALPGIDLMRSLQYINGKLQWI